MQTKFFLLLGFLATACEPFPGNSLPGDEIACDWFLEDNNCWRQSLGSFATNLPTSTTTGVFAADGKTCTYSSGHEVLFKNPIDLASLGESNSLRDFPWDVEVRLGGDSLAIYREPSRSDMLLTTPLGTFKLEMVEGSLLLTCPGGRLLNVPMPALLATCDQNTLPGKSVRWDAQGVRLVLLGDNRSGVVLFNCQVPGSP